MTEDEKLMVLALDALSDATGRLDSTRIKYPESGYADVKGMLLKRLESEPTALDVTETSDSARVECVECSKCGKTGVMAFEDYAYCPYCGREVHAINRN